MREVFLVKKGGNLIMNGLFGGGNGTEVSPYLIEDVQDLQAIDSNADKFFKQVVDIDLVGVDWYPLCEETSFTGSYDGGNFKIKNLTINQPTMYDVALFCWSESGTFKNINIENCNVTGKDGVAALVAKYNVRYKDNGLMENCHSSGVIKGKSSGGLLGYWNMYEAGFKGTIKDCSTSCSVTGGNAGGFAYNVSTGGGQHLLTVENCTATGNVTSDTDYSKAGGFLGDMYTNTGQDEILIKNCVATGNVKAPKAGAFIGALWTNGGGDKISFVKCFADGDVTGEDCVAGFAGNMYTGSTNDIISFKECEIHSTVIGTGKVGGLVGEGSLNGSTDSIIVEDCFVRATIESSDVVGGLFGAANMNSASPLFKVSNSLFVGTVAGPHKDVLFGSYDKWGASYIPTVTDVFFDVTLAAGATAILSIPKTSAQLTQKDTFVGWDFKNVWYMAEDGMQLRAFYEVPQEPEVPEEPEEPVPGFPSDIVIVTDVNFRKTKMLRDHFGTPIPQVWDHENERWVPVTLQMVLFMANS